MTKDVYKMELHETFEINRGLSVTRVPGGWIYEKFYFGMDTSTSSSAFVPFPEPFIGFPKEMEPDLNQADQAHP